MRAVLAAAIQIDQPGTVIHLPFEWPESIQDATQENFEPPITTYLKKHIRQVPRFIRGDIPPEFRV